MRLTEIKRLIGVAGAGLLAGCLGCAAPQREVLTAHRIELVDDAGVVRARLAVEGGSAGLFLLDADGRRRGALVHDESQTALFIFDEHGSVRVGAAQFAHGGGGFALHGASGRGGAVLYLKDASGSLTMYDTEGEIVARFPSQPPEVAPPEDDR